jgi:membrane protease YdiL (CAAX protease family)
LREREQQIELAVFLFLVGPTLLLSFAHGGQVQLSFPLLAISVIARDLSLVALVLFFLWRNGEPRLRIGWTLAGTGREIGLGVLLFVPLQVGAALLERALSQLGLTTPAHLPANLHPAGASQVALALLLVLVVAVAEETIFRGYLLLRLRSLTANSALVVASSSVLFAIGHGYEGSAGVVTVGALGAAFALVYLWRRSLVAPVTLHFLVDFVGLLLAPAVGHG